MSLVELNWPSIPIWNCSNEPTIRKRSIELGRDEGEISVPNTVVKWRVQLGRRVEVRRQIKREPRPTRQE